jgi:hypothetical protein
VGVSQEVPERALPPDTAADVLQTHGFLLRFGELASRAEACSFVVKASDPATRQKILACLQAAMLVPHSESLWQRNQLLRLDHGEIFAVTARADGHDRYLVGTSQGVDSLRLSFGALATQAVTAATGVAGLPVRQLALLPELKLLVLLEGESRTLRTAATTILEAIPSTGSGPLSASGTAGLSPFRPRVRRQGSRASQALLSNQPLDGAGLDGALPGARGVRSFAVGQTVTGSTYLLASTGDSLLLYRYSSEQGAFELQQANPTEGLSPRVAVRWLPSCERFAWAGTAFHLLDPESQVSRPLLDTECASFSQHLRLQAQGEALPLDVVEMDGEALLLVAFSSHALLVTAEGQPARSHDVYLWYPLTSPVRSVCCGDSFVCLAAVGGYLALLHRATMTWELLDGLGSSVTCFADGERLFVCHSGAGREGGASVTLVERPMLAAVVSARDALHDLQSVSASPGEAPFLERLDTILHALQVQVRSNLNVGVQQRNHVVSLMV